MSYHPCVFLGLKSSCCQRCCLFSSVIHTLYSWSGGSAGNKISATQTTRGFNWDKIVAREQKSDSASCILIHCEMRICCMWKKKPPPFCSKASSFLKLVKRSCPACADYWCWVMSAAADCLALICTISVIMQTGLLLWVGLLKQQQPHVVFQLK